MMNYKAVAGDGVFTRDGEKLGAVKESQELYFQVHVAMRPDYWLPQTMIAEAARHRLVVAFNKDELGEYKYEQPDGARSGQASGS